MKPVPSVVRGRDHDGQANPMRASLVPDKLADDLPGDGSLLFVIVSRQVV